MAQNNCQLVVTGLQGKREVVTVAKNCTIDQLYDVVRQRCAATVSVDELRLVYGGSEMERGKGSTIEDFDIPNMGQIFMVIRLRGGVTLLWIHLEQPPSPVHRCQKTKPRSSAVTMTSSCYIAQFNY